MGKSGFKGLGMHGGKGQLEDFLALFFIGICVLVVTGIMLLVLFSTAKDRQDEINSDINVKNGFFSTRMVLSQDVRPGYTVYDLLADTDFSSDAAANSFNQQLLGVLSGFYPEGKITDDWLVIIDDKCYILGASGLKPSEITEWKTAGSIPVSVTTDACSAGEKNKLPKTTVPNPDGKNMMVVFKVANELDAKQPRYFGYRAGLLQGTAPSAWGAMTAPDGTPLERIENIPNVTCDEQETSVGKICYARPELVAQLRTLSEKELAPNGEKIVITQAFRTRDIQMALYKKACSEGCDCSSGDCEFARNPDKLTNPSGHMGGTAIDAIVSDSAGNKLNGDGGTNPAGAEKIMCMNNEGFVRWKKESWHFEYGSYNWGKAEELRTEGKTVCSFPS